MSDDTHSSPTILAAHQFLLRERLHKLVATIHPLLRADILVALEEGGKLLAQPPGEQGATKPALPSGVWPLLTFLIARSIAPDSTPLYASSVAVAVECFISSLDLLDDVEDEDQTSAIKKLGTARALNVSTTLLMLAQRAILSGEQEGIAASTITQLLHILAEATLLATAGQHRDLLAERASVHDFTQEDCIEIASWKAGALMRVVCQLGARCANASDTSYALFSELGMCWGIAQQLDNDSHDLYHLLQSKSSAKNSLEKDVAHRSQKTDMLRQKKTLPVVLAAKELPSLHNIFTMDDNNSEELYAQYTRALHEGILATWGISLLYRERAYDCLQKLEDIQPVSPELRSLLGL